MRRIVKSILAFLLILAICAGVVGVYVSQLVYAANLGSSTVVHEGVEVSWTGSYALPSSVQGALTAQGITIRSSNTSNYSVDGNNGFMCISAGRESPNGTTGTVYRCVNTRIYDNENDSRDSSHNTLKALSGLTYSQIAYGCYSLGKNGGASWAYAHAILSYLIGEDATWFSPLASSYAYSALTTFAAAAAAVGKTCSADHAFYVFVSASGKQNLISLSYNPPPETGHVSLRKEDQNGDPVIGAVITLVTTSGADVSGLRANIEYTEIENGIRFTTNGTEIRIDGLKPDSSYSFYEVSVPANSNYELAVPRTASFSTDSNGNPSVAGASGWNASTYTYTMIDRSSPTGEVTFNKVGSSEGIISDLKTAGITFAPYGHTVDMSAAGSVTVTDHTNTAQRYEDRIVFTTAAEGVDIEFGNLPAGQYVFIETDTPEGYSTANPIYVTVGSDGSVTPKSGNIVMTDNRSIDNLNFGSISLRKEWTGGYSGGYTPENFWSDVSNITFGMYYWSDWDSFEYQCITGPNAHTWDNHSAFVWGKVPESGAGRSYGERWVDSETGLHYCDVGWDVAGHNETISSLSEGFPGRYWQYYTTYDQQNEWVDWPVYNGVASASYMTCLPFGYYVVTEEWDEGIFMSGSVEEMFIDTENASGWHDMSSGSHKKYVMVFHITAEGTFVCGNWGSNAHTASLPNVAVNDGENYVANYQTTYRAVVQNVENTGAVDVVKIDETGNGVDGVSFELWRSGGGRVATGTIADPDHPSGVTAEGYNTYDVNWTYRTERQTGDWGHYEAITHKNVGYVGDLRYGRYWIAEYITDSSGDNAAGNYRVPEGWEAGPSDSDGNPQYFWRYVYIDSSCHDSPLSVPISNREYRLHIETYKVDERTGDVISGYSGLSEASFELYADLNGNGIIDSSDRLLGEESDTDRDGVVVFDYRFSDDNMFPEISDPDEFPERYLIRETHAPEGYYLNNNPAFAIVNEASGYSAYATITDIPYIRMDTTVYKFDEWEGYILSGYGGDYNASFSLYADMNHDGLLDDDDILIDTLSDTDRDGIVNFSYVLTPEVINSKFTMMDLSDPLNYPVDYLVIEQTAPFDFYRNSNVFRISMPPRQYEVSASEYIEETPYSANVKVYKLDGDTGEDIRNAVFTIYNDTDNNGVFTESVDTVAKSYIDGVLSDAVFVWNQTEGCYISSDLRSGRYIVVETGLPSGYFYVDAGGHPSLTRNEALIEVVGRDTSVTDFVPDEYEVTMYNTAPSIHTTLISPVTGSHVAPIGTDVELVDTVTYRNIVPGIEYVMTGTLMDRATGQPLLDGNGQKITASTTFVPSSSNGTVDVVFTLNTEILMREVEDGLAEAPRDLVSFEELRIAPSVDLTNHNQWYVDDPVAVHNDINDAGQTVRIGQIRTGVYDSGTLDQITSSGLATIIDNVHYEGLQPGVTYEMRGHMHLVSYDANGNRTDGGEIHRSVSEEILEPVTSFTPSEQEGYVQVTYVIDTERFRGKTLVSFEDLYQNDIPLMHHADIDDQYQTIEIPDVHTNAYGSDVNGDIVAYGECARITDTVSYNNLLVGRQYMVQGFLYWMYEDENGFIHSGPVSDFLGDVQATSTAVFTAESPDGAVDMEFTFDSRVLADLHYDRLVVMENLYYLNTMTRISYHWDLNDEGQTVYIPGVRTTAADGVTGGKTITETADATVTDRVYYSNLEPGREYTVRGSVQYIKTDSNGNVSTGTLIQNGEEVSAHITFVPTEPNGFVDMTFTVNALELQEIDRLVVFEDMYAGPGIRIAMHADLNDEGQTILICRLSSQASGSDGTRSVAPSDNVTVIDRVFYEGLIPGREYRMETDVMNTSTGGSEAHRSTVFVPDASNGSIDITVSFDGSEFTSEKLVIFECVYDDATGVLIKAHEDWNDKNQSLSFVPQTGLIDDPSYRYTGFTVLGAGAVIAATWITVSKKRKEKYE